jgi:actin-like protein 6A
VPALYFSRDAVLSAFASGRTSAVVVDAGASGTTVAPVHDGFVLLKGVQRSVVGGDFMDEQLVALYAAQGRALPPRHRVRKAVDAEGRVTGSVALPHRDAADPSFEQYALRSIARDIRETHGRVWMESCFDQAGYDLYALTVPQPAFELPDGTTFVVGSERVRVPESLMNPVRGAGADALAAAGARGLPALVYDAVASCAVELRKDLLQGVLLVGGNSSYPGFSERLTREMTALVPAAYKLRFITPSPLERRLAVWIGGSILASLGSFQQLWLSKKEWAEGGESALFRRCA